MIGSGVSGQVQEYCHQVSSGELVACKAVRAAVERHLNDLNRQDTDGFPYYFDANRANTVCDFFPICLRHTIGDYATLPLSLEPWQLFSISALYGWRRREDDARRFRKCFWSMARKNGKSTVAAGLAIFHAAMDVNPLTGKPESVSQVILAASKKEQAQAVIFSEVLRMREKSEDLQAISKYKFGQVIFPENHGSIACIGSDRSYDGLNPQAVIIDELHSWLSTKGQRGCFDTMLSGSGYRRQPMILIVTTAGNEASEIWLEEYEFAKAVALGDVKDESLWSIIYELDKEDDPLDESVWLKANPNLGISVRLDYLQREAKPAARIATAKTRFTRYHQNRLVSSHDQAFQREQWQACKGALTDWDEAAAVALAFDLGGHDDLASVAAVAKFPMGEDEDGGSIWRYEVEVRNYLASSCQRDLTQAPWASWLHEGYIQQCQHVTSQIQKDLLELAEIWPIEAVAYDPWNARQLAEELEAEGLCIAKVPQNCGNFSEPIADMLQAIHDRRFTHPGDPVLTWATQNAVTVTNAQGRTMFDKGWDKSKKIDPVVAMTMAYRVAMLAKTKASGALYV